MTLAAAIRSMLELREGLHPQGRPGAWQVHCDAVRGGYIVVPADAIGQEPVLEISESHLAETEVVAAAEDVDLVAYLMGCVG